MYTKLKASSMCAGLALLVFQTVGSVVMAAEEPKKGGAVNEALPAPIEASGCVRKGVESGCLILTSTKDKKTYNLYFPAGKPPAVDTAISFTGKLHSGPTICMQGTPVDVTKWTQIRMPCPPEDTKASK